MDLYKRFLILGLLFGTLMASASFALGYYEPNSCSGSWVNCNKVYGPGLATLSAPSYSALGGIWSGYGVSPSSLAGKTVYLSAGHYVNTGPAYVLIYISADGGNTYGPVHVLSNTSNGFFQITNDVNWQSSGPIVVRANCFGMGITANCGLDYLGIVAY